MSLIKKRPMSEKQLAANRRNIKLSHGPATAEGWERIRAAHLRHGFYAAAEEVALRALGEDPEQYRQLLAGLWEEYDPVGVSQEGLVIRLARATWLMNRADRMQEGYAVRQAQDAGSGRQDRLHARMMRLKITAESLSQLGRSVADEHYVTTPDDLAMMKSLKQEEEIAGTGEIALALFYQLQAPGVGEDGEDELEKARRVVAQVKSIFGIGMTAEPEPPEEPTEVAPSPQSWQELYPRITAADWEARQRPRRLLENILKRQVDVCEEQRRALLKESLRGPSPYERAAEIAPIYPDARLMRRMQDSNFREVRRTTSLLLKLKRRQPPADAVQPAPASHHVSETKGISDEAQETPEIVSD